MKRSFTTRHRYSIIRQPSITPMLFNYRLLPLDRVDGVKDDNGRNVLDWIHLTAGEFWVDTGAGELFRHADAMLPKLRARGWEVRSPYYDGFVSSLMYSVLQMVPYVLEPVPDRVLAVMEPSYRTRMWGMDRMGADARQGKPLDPAFGALMDRVGEWIGRRQLYTGFIVFGPHAWFWTDSRGTLSIRWDNHVAPDGKTPVWAAREGMVTMPVDRFVEDVRDFHHRLMDDVAQRLAAIVRDGLPTDALIDADALWREHRESVALLDQAVAQRPRTDWGDVLAAAAELERVHPFEKPRRRWFPFIQRRRE